MNPIDSEKTLANERMSDEVVAVSECPTCRTFAPVIVLTSLETNDLVFLCLGCETAWRTPPSPDLDEVASLREVAPGGIRLPTSTEIQRLGGILTTKVNIDEWGEEIDRIIRR